jgi:hypothetical protein
VAAAAAAAVASDQPAIGVSHRRRYLFIGSSGSPVDVQSQRCKPFVRPKALRTQLLRPAAVSGAPGTMCINVVPLVVFAPARNVPARRYYLYEATSENAGCWSLLEMVTPRSSCPRLGLMAWALLTTILLFAYLVRDSGLCYIK